MYGHSPITAPAILTITALLTIAGPSCRSSEPTTPNEPPQPAATSTAAEDAGPVVEASWCANSSDPSPANFAPEIQFKIDLARDLLESDKLLPPEWELCARSMAEAGVWWVECRPRGPYLNSAITVVIRDDRIERRFYSDAFDSRTWIEPARYDPMDDIRRKRLSEQNLRDQSQLQRLRQEIIEQRKRSKAAPRSDQPAGVTPTQPSSGPADPPRADPPPGGRGS